MLFKIEGDTSNPADKTALLALVAGLSGQPVVAAAAVVDKPAVVKDKPAAVAKDKPVAEVKKTEEPAAEGPSREDVAKRVQASVKNTTQVGRAKVVAVLGKFRPAEGEFANEAEHPEVKLPMIEKGRYAELDAELQALWPMPRSDEFKKLWPA